MNQSAAVGLTLLVLVVMANLPFFAPRMLIVGPRRPQRGIGWRLLELLLLGGLAIGLGVILEMQVGQRHSQGWVFYVTLLCLLLTFASPGFVWRFLRRGHDD
ncbi:MAG: DUF2818 family protein [Burkholderiales bacterium]|nr:DUF2818 family protein [Burkholderiales bacterium]